MNLVNYQPRCIATTLLIAIMSLTGCANKADIALEKQRVAEQKQLKEKIEQLEQELAEWHQMKAGLSRLIVIEGDLKLLVEQLTMLAGGTMKPTSQRAESPASAVAVAEVSSSDSKQHQSHTAVSMGSDDRKQLTEPMERSKTTNATNGRVENKVPELLAKREYASAYPGAPEQLIEKNSKALNDRSTKRVVTKVDESMMGYALQLSSVDKFSRIEPTWFELNSRFGSQLAGYIPRYERVLVNGKTYYRIKVGEFTQRQQALTACTSMKQSGLDCIVATSTGINLYSS